MADELDHCDAVRSERLSRKDQIILGALALAFLGRVLTQVVQRFASVSWLPGFEDWQSGSVPYWSLLLMQVALLALMASVLLTRRLVPRRWVGAVQTFGVVYFVAMLLRLGLGSTVARGHGFLDRPLPSVFHMVIAGFVITWATRGQTAVASPS